MRRAFEATPSMRGVGVLETSTADPPAIESTRRRARPPLDRLELCLLATFAAVSMWLVALDLWQVIVNGRIWTGTDGVYITDQMQYLGWIASASHTGLVADLFVIHPTAAVYFQPAVLVSGLLAAAGVAPALALLVWKPVAVGALFFGFRAYAVRTVERPGRWPRLTVMTLALFYGCFTSVYGNFGVVGDLFPGFLSWGYPFALMAMGLLAVALIGYDRARSEGRMAWAPGLLAALAGLLHPWQGEVFVLIVAGSELLGGGLTRAELRRGLGSPRIRLAVATVLTAMLPLLYYYGLGKLNSSWELGQEASKHAFPAIAIGLGLAPLALVALLGVRGAATGGFMGRTLIAWPLACVVLYLQSYTSQGATPLHAFDGITLPLAVLAVNGSMRAGFAALPRRGLIAACLLALFTIPTTYWEMKEARKAVMPAFQHANFIQADERHALDFLAADPTTGGVISSPYLGMMVPSATGRHTYDGNCIWSEPNCYGRNRVTTQLLAGQLGAVAARQLVSGSRARFVLLACGSARARVKRELRPLTATVHDFGCASIVQVRS